MSEKKLLLTSDNWQLTPEKGILKYMEEKCGRRTKQMSDVSYQLSEDNQTNTRIHVLIIKCNHSKPV